MYILRVFHRYMFQGTMRSLHVPSLHFLKRPCFLKTASKYSVQISQSSKEIVSNGDLFTSGTPECSDVTSLTFFAGVCCGNSLSSALSGDLHSARGFVCPRRRMAAQPCRRASLKLARLGSLGFFGVASHSPPTFTHHAPKSNFACGSQVCITTRSTA